MCGFEKALHCNAWAEMWRTRCCAFRAVCRPNMADLCWPGSWAVLTLSPTPFPTPPPQVPLILTTSFPDAVPANLRASVASVKQHKYDVVLSKNLVPRGQELSREEAALVRQPAGTGAAGWGGVGWDSIACLRAGGQLCPVVFCLHPA